MKDDLILQGKVCVVEVQVGSASLGEALMHRGRQALGGLPLKVGFVPSPGARPLVTTTMVPSGTQRHTGGRLSSQTFLLPFIPIKYLSLNISPCAGLETCEDGVCVCVCFMFTIPSCCIIVFG